MDFAYDREAFLEWKQGLKKELESILKSLEDPET